MKFETLENRCTLAADPYLLKNIQVESEISGSNPTSFIRVGGHTFFTADTPQTGRELWITDGTAAGTKLVKDINPFGNKPSNPNHLTEVNGTLFFAASDGASGEELWKSDGTEAGTVRVANIAFRRYASSNPDLLVNVNGTLYFSAAATTEGSRNLWRSDGTEAGTIEVEQSDGSSLDSVRETINFNGSLFFKTGISGLYSLWSTDSSSSIATRFPNVTASGSKMEVFGGQLFFGATTPSTGMELWKSDGTVTGTTPLAQIVPGQRGSYPFLFTQVGNQLFFVAERPGENQQLWKTDGTTAGTVQVRAVNTASGLGAAPRQLTNVGGQLYYVGQSETGFDLWTSDGTTAGTILVNDFEFGYGSMPNNLVNVNGQLFFSIYEPFIGTELWTSGGTAATTRLFKEFLPGAQSGLWGLSVADGVMYMAADDGRGSELWKSNGTLAGTVFVSELSQVNRSGVTETTTSGITLGGTLYYFNGEGAQSGFGPGLWKTDGTAPGTQLVKLLPSSFRNFADNLQRTMSVLNGTLYFVAEGENDILSLWKSDGTETGTIPVTQLTLLPASMVNVGGKLFFEGLSSSVGTELWQSDGTAAGTKLVKDIQVGRRGSFPRHLFNHNGILYFTAETSAGRELWRSNGTEAGTVQVLDIASGVGSAFTRDRDPEFVNVSGTLYFAAADSSNGVELWRTGGTSATTTRVRDISPGATGSNPTSLTNVNGTLFFSANDGTTGFELWKSRGTAASTVLVRDLTPGAGTYRPTYLTNVGGILYFSGLEFGGGRELWRSDGTTVGTNRILDILPGKESSQPHSLTNVDGTLHFVATSAAGTELWTTDGTLAGTRMVADLQQPGSSDPFRLTALGSTLIFAANTLAFGKEWWALETRSPDGVRILDDTSSGFTLTGTWSQLPAGRNAQAFVAPAGSGNSVASWSFDQLTAGTYRIYATWTADTDRSTTARYRVRESLTSSTNLMVKSVSQRLPPSGLTDQGSIWSDLGTLTIAGPSLVVQLSNNTTNGRVVADAIRIQRVGP